MWGCVSVAQCYQKYTVCTVKHIYLLALQHTITLKGAHHVTMTLSTLQRGGGSHVLHLEKKEKAINQ